MKGNNDYLMRALSDMEFIEQHMKDIHSMNELISNALLLDSMSFRLSQIAESILKIIENFKNAHLEIPWTDIKGFRNRLVHDYGNVNYEFDYIAVKDDIPFLKKRLEKIMPDCV